MSILLCRINTPPVNSQLKKHKSVKIFKLFAQQGNRQNVWFIRVVNSK